MPYPNRHALLLLLALTATLALGVAHAFDHPALGHADHACAVCAHGAGLDHAPLPALPAYVALSTAAPNAAPLRPVRAAARVAGYRSRAPPTFPA